jgi:hypothetical protein
MLYMLVKHVHLAFAQAASVCAHAAVTCCLRVQELVQLTSSSRVTLHEARCPFEQLSQHCESARPACPYAWLHACRNRAWSGPRHCHATCSTSACAHAAVTYESHVQDAVHFARLANYKIREVRCRHCCSGDYCFQCTVYAYWAISCSAKARLA